MSAKSTLIALFVALALLATACGSDDTTDVSVADGESQSQPADPDADPDPDPDADPDPATEPTPGDSEPEADDPIPVEPDGGIGDGAEPLPGAEEPAQTGTWHGAQLAETNCPGTEWQRVQANEFSFSVPSDFVKSDVQPIDSEVGVWTGGNNIEVLYDYGWYSGSISDSVGAENEAIDFSGIVGEQTVLRDGADNQVGVFFGEVAVADGQADRLSMVVAYVDASDEIIGRCIVGSIEWNE